MTVEAIDPERTVKVAPFLYLSKDASLNAVPFGIALDKEEDKELTGADSIKIHGVKVVQKTLHSDESYQIFELAKQSEGVSDTGDFGVFALNIEDISEA